MRMVNRVWSDFIIVIIVIQALVYKIKEIKLMKQGYITTWLDYELTNQNAPTKGIKFE